MDGPPAPRRRPPRRRLRARWSPAARLLHAPHLRRAARGRPRRRDLRARLRAAPALRRRPGRPRRARGVGLRHRAQRAARGAAPGARRAPRARPPGRRAARAGSRGADPHRGARRARRAALRGPGALAELGPEQREAVRLRVVDELGYPAVAARLGVSEQTARARVSRGLRALAAAVNRHETGAQLRRERARPRGHPRRAGPGPARGVGAPAAAPGCLALAARARPHPGAAGARPHRAGHPRRDLGPRSGAAPRGGAPARRGHPSAHGSTGLRRGGRRARRRVAADGFGLRLRPGTGRRGLPHGARGRGRGALRPRQPPARRGRQPERPRAAPGADLLRSRVGTHLGLRRAAGRGEHRRRDQRGGPHARRRDARDPDAVAKGGLPTGMRVFVAVLDGAHDVPLVTARDASGAALLVCREGRCAPPTQGGTP